MSKALWISLFMLGMSFAAKAAQCEYSVEVNGRVIAAYQGQSSGECIRAQARCENRALRVGGICVNGGRTQGPTPPRTQPPRRPGPDPIPQPRPNPYPSPSSSIRVGDRVYPDNWSHGLGATVLQYNHRTGEYRIKSNQSGSVFTFTAENLSVAYGCIASVCVTDKVFPENWDHALGAQVLAQNSIKQTLIVKSNQSGSVFSFSVDNLLLGDGCVNAMCVGDHVYPLNWSHALGAEVIAMSDVNDTRRSEMVFKIKSKQSGSVFSFSRDNLAVTRGCHDGFCVGQRVYPRNWSHSLGGTILALHKRQGVFVVKSNQSGNVFTFNSYDL
ncbi:MAG: hypothetical protein CME62_00105 [Halobacteriovoraceae bacterium]|nr:hypothetical protein [Halobacteriovoraceae bacterium]|tara:strand:- start:1726 stop:2709 length:984 start_codon:yes stop_codon:yes gene_type:complete